MHPGIGKFTLGMTTIYNGTNETQFQSGLIILSCTNSTPSKKTYSYNFWHIATQYKYPYVTPEHTFTVFANVSSSGTAVEQMQIPENSEPPKTQDDDPTS